MDSNIFNFGEKLPTPYEGVPKKNSISSKHAAMDETPGAKTGSTLFAPMVKALQRYRDMKFDAELGGIGSCSDAVVVEYYSERRNRTDVVFRKKERIYASVFDGSELAFAYSIPKAATATEKAASAKYAPKEDMTAIFLSLLPELLEDEEFNVNYNEWEADENNLSALYILCDNCYRRLKNKKVVVNFPARVFDGINLTALEQGELAPDVISRGSFKIVSKADTSGSGTKKEEASAEVLKKFIGKYKTGRVFSPAEEALVPQIPKNIILAKEAEDICETVSVATEDDLFLRNYLLVGPAGTGKSTVAPLVAAGLHRPFVSMCLSADTQMDSLYGFIRMKFDDEVANDEMPSAEDICFDPVASYKMITGEENSDATSEDCMKALMSRSDAKTFVYQDTPLVQAFRYGYVIEIQEPTVVAQQGVLVGLNSLLEEGVINLPNGETVKRHPDCVVIITTNVDYNGCRGMNQSFVDRCVPIMMPLPEKEVMIRRCAAKTGETDTALLSELYELTLAVKEYAQSKGISDGEVGYRAFQKWVALNRIFKNKTKSAKMSVIPAATLNEEDQEDIFANVLAPKIKGR